MVYNGKPLSKWMIWGKNRYFWKHPYTFHVLLTQTTRVRPPCSNDEMKISLQNVATLPVQVIMEIPAPHPQAAEYNNHGWSTNPPLTYTPQK